MKKSILKIAILLSIFSVILNSCSKNDNEPEAETMTSFTMTYNGVTYTEADPNSLILGLGTISAKGTTGDGFLLTVIGIGDDGTTTNICPDPSVCDDICSLMLDFGAAEGKEGFVATSGTVKRTGNKIEISATGIGTTDFGTKTLSATIEVKVY